MEWVIIGMRRIKNHLVRLTFVGTNRKRVCQYLLVGNILLTPSHPPRVGVYKKLGLPRIEHLKGPGVSPTGVFFS